MLLIDGVLHKIKEIEIAWKFSQIKYYYYSGDPNNGLVRYLNGYSNGDL